MPEGFSALHPVHQALLATCFTWALTALGAASVYLIQTVRQKILDGMMGFAAGVMIAASFWSLLAPAIEMSRDGPVPEWLPAIAGFLAGGFFLAFLDRILPHLHSGLPVEAAEGIPTRWKRSVLLVLAVTLHNIPEGLAVGVAFGAAASGFPGATLTSACVLALGIGIQNFPEGLAVSMPLRRDGMTAGRSFWYGQLSGMVEPVAGVIGAWAVLTMQAILPYALSFAAGAMIFVVVEELIPESRQSGHADLAAVCTLCGFSVMMFLDLALG